MRGLTRVMRDLAAGQLDRAVPATERLNEIGAMARAVRTLRDAAVERQQFEAAVERAAAEKATNAGQLERALGSFQDAMRGVTETVSRNTTDMGQMAEALTAISTQSARPIGGRSGWSPVAASYAHLTHSGRIAAHATAS